jgi:hypothetical protein
VASLEIDAHTLIPTTDGGVIVLGLDRRQRQISPAAERFDERGSPDLTFGNHGVARAPVPFEGVAMPTDGTIKNDGDLVVSADQPAGLGSLTPVLFAFLPTGAVDLSFGKRGVVLTGAAGFGLSANVAIASDGALLQATEEGPFRFTPAGVRDEEFSANVQPSPSKPAFALETTPDGRVVIAGRTSAADDRQPPACGMFSNGVCFHPVWLTSTLLADGGPAAAFGSGGVVATDPGAPYWNEVVPGPIAAAPTGRLTTVAIASEDGETDNLVVLRLGF